MIRDCFIAAVGLLALGAGVASASDVLTLSREDQTRLGVSTVTLSAREERESVHAIIRAVDPGALFTLEADLKAARAAVATSGDELRRLETLAGEDNSASRKSVQAASQQTASDVARLDLLKHRLAVEWGKSFADMPSVDVARLADDLATGEAALVRADCPGQPAGVSGDIEFATSPGAASVNAKALGLSGSADARLQTIGLYGVVRGEAAAPIRPGRVFYGEIKASKTELGVVIPRAAIVRLDGADFVYVKTGGETFERRQIRKAAIIEDGWFVTDGFSPGEAIVALGAGSLVALDRGADAAESD